MPQKTTQSKSLKPTPGTSLHRQLFMVLNEQITRGLYLPGALLPSEDELGQRFNVSRITVRRALMDLENKGLVEKRQGRGTFVSMTLPEKPPAATLNLVDTLQKQAADTAVEVLNVETTNAPAAIGLQLQLEKDERVIHASRLRSSNNVPLMVTDAWVPEHLGNNVTAQELKKRALYEILMEQGIKFGRVVQEITATAADPYHAQLLQVDIGMPLLKLTRLMYDQEREPILHLTVHMSPERSRILMDISAELVNTLAAGYIAHDLIQS